MILFILYIFLLKFQHFAKYTIITYHDMIISDIIRALHIRRETGVWGIFHLWTKK